MITVSLKDQNGRDLQIGDVVTYKGATGEYILDWCSHHARIDLTGINNNVKFWIRNGFSQDMVTYIRKSEPSDVTRDPDDWAACLVSLDMALSKCSKDTAYNTYFAQPQFKNPLYFVGEVRTTYYLSDIKSNSAVGGYSRLSAILKEDGSVELQLVGNEPFMSTTKNWPFCNNLIRYVEEYIERALRVEQMKKEKRSGS